MGQPHKAIAYFKSSLAMPVRQEDDKGLEHYRDLAEAYYKAGQIDSAYYYLDRYVQWAQTYYDKEKTRQIIEVESKYKVREAERENKILLEEKEWANTKNRLFLFCLVLLLAGLAVSFYFIRQLRLGKATIEAQRNQLDLLLTDVTKANQMLKDLSAEKQLMVSILAHDLRSPLNNVRTGTALLKTWSADAKWSDMLERIDRSAGKIQDSINRILEVEQADKSIGKAQTGFVDLASAARLAVGQYLDAANLVGVGIELETQGSDIVVRADANLLEQVIGNLISNAIRFAPDNSRVAVLIGRAADGEALLSVTDQGPGIAQEEQELIFQKYYSVEASGEQKHLRGLGLYFVRQYIEEIGGKVTVESTPGGGSTFRVVIPN
jgi:signal transduction histidine kinase